MTQGIADYIVNKVTKSGFWSFWFMFGLFYNWVLIKVFDIYLD